MSKNEKVEIKSRKKDQTKDEQTRVNKKRKNENKRPTEKSGREADNISNAFPNFSVLSEEERVVFFEALTTARKSIEKRGIPTRVCFGTVHDEYLKYFDQNEGGEEKQEENRSIRSSLTIRDSSDQTLGKIDQERPEENKCSLPIFSLKKSTPIISEPESWKIPESIIQIETDKSLDLFFKKKRRNEEETDSLQFNEMIFKNHVTQRNFSENWAQNMLPNRSNTPKFDALSPDEKEVFFKILQEAHDNVIEKNQNKECHILPLDTILSRYRGNNEVTSVFATSQDTLPREKSKRELKMTVTLESRDNERLLMSQTIIPSEAVIAETSKKYTSKKPYPLEVTTNESEEGDKNSCQSEELRRTQSEVQEDTLTECKKSETEAPLKKPCTSSETSPVKKKIRFSATPAENDEENQLKKEENPVVLEVQQTPLTASDLRLNSDKNLPALMIEKNSEETGDVDSQQQIEGTPKESVKEQPTVVADKSSEDCKSMEVKEKVKPMLEDCEVRPVTVGEVTTQERLESKKTKSEPPIKKVSFFTENLEEESSEVMEKESENERKEKPEKEEARRVKGKAVKERISTEDTPRTEPREHYLSKVMIVNGDVVGKIKSLIYYLEAKANKNTHLEKEYLKLLVDYADYLSKVLESLILKREREQKKQRNNYEVPGFSRFHEGSKKIIEPEFLTYSVSTMGIKRNHQSMASTEESPKEHNADLDSNLPVLSGPESGGSEGETRFWYRIHERDKIPITKIRLLQVILRQRAKFVEGDFGNFKIIQIPEGEFMPEEKPPSRKLLPEDEEKAQQEKKKKFLKALVICCTCKKKMKKTVDEGIGENLKGEAVRVDLSDTEMKDAASEILNQFTSEVLKAAERKKIMDNYFMDS